MMKANSSSKLVYPILLHYYTHGVHFFSLVPTAAGSELKEELFGDLLHPCLSLLL